MLSTIMSASLSSNPGWSTAGQWAFGQPAGQTQNPFYSYPDPSSGRTGLNVYGVNLYGDYSTAVGGPYYLKTGPIDCSNFTNVNLSFYRWLNTDTYDWVSATFEVSNNGTTWTTVARNFDAVYDNSWQLTQLDIKAYADQKATVYLRWGYQVFQAGATACSGWNIDDITLTGDLTAPTPGITVTPTSGLTTTEAGGTASFTMVLKSQPTANVTIGLSSSDTTEGTVSPSSVTFNSTNWSTPQTVTVTGVNDALLDGSIAYTIITAAASSSDANYNGINPANVSVTNEDNDVPSLTLTIAAPTISESGGAHATTGTVTRNTATTNPMVVTLSSSDPTEATVPASVTIPAGQASATFDIAAVDDAVLDGTQSVTITASTASSGTPAALDSSFGTAGTVTTSLTMSIQPPDNALAIQPDGKILAASENSANAFAWRLTRYNSNGSVDTGFGLNGNADTYFSTMNPLPHKIVVQSDGKILVGGQLVPDIYNMVIARFNADGSPDASFGYGGVAEFYSIYYQWIEDMVQCADGKILLAVGINGTPELRVARLNSDGSLDSTFGTDGIKNYSGMNVTANAITLQADGKFILTGSSGSEAKIIRANADGSLDTTFGTSGVQTVNFGTTYTTLYDVAVDNIGRIVLGGNAAGANNTSNFAVVRLNPNGSFDTSFSGDGMATTNFPAGLDDGAYSVDVQSDNRIILSGYTETSDNVNQAAFVRYAVDGSLDTSFDTDGMFKTSITSKSAQSARSAALQTDGKLVVLSGAADDVRLARFDLGGAPLTGTATLNVTDNDGTEPPTVTAQTPLPGSTINTSSTNIDITFSKAVQGVDATDLVLTGAAAAAAVKGTPTNISGNTWRFPVSGLTNGSLNVSLAPDANDIEDLFGNDLANVVWSYTVTMSFTNPATISIPAWGASTPYPSNITVSGLLGTITDVNVMLTGLSHAYANGIDILLVGPTGQKIVLLSDVGSTYSISNVNLTLDDAAASSLPTSSKLSSGTYKPLNYDENDILFPPAPQGPSATSLAAFNGTNPNGTWSLYVMGDSDSDSGTISGGWSLLITTPGGTATIGDKVWNDLDSDGVQDAGEPGIANWEVYLDSNANGQWNAGEPKTVTDTNGNYLFNGLTAGTYRVVQVPRAFWTQTSPASPTAYLVTLTDGQTRNDVDFGNFDLHTLPPAEIRGTAWKDLDSDGIQDNGEPGMAGVGVEVYLTGDTTIGNSDDIFAAQAVSDNAGNYFLSLPPTGSYYLRYHTPVGYTFTAKDAGGNDALDSDADSSGLTALFTLSSGQTDVNHDVGLLGSSPTFGWAVGFGGTGTDATINVIADASGNVFCTGFFTGTMDFDNGPGVCSLTSTGYYDTFVAKYSPTGSLLWARRIGGSNDDVAIEIRLGNDGSVLLAGRFQSTVDFDLGDNTYNLTSAGWDDIFVLKLDSEGNFRWARGMGGTGFDYATSLTVDSAGNIFTAGSFYGTVDFDPGAGTFNLTSAGSSDIFISKLDASGNFVWAKQLGGTNSDDVSSIMLGTDGSIYTIGGFRETCDFDPGSATTNLTSAGSSDLFVSKLDQNGSYVWAKRIGGKDDDWGSSFALGADGSVFATGYFQGTVDFDPGSNTYNLTSPGTFSPSDVFVSKWDSAGNFVWAQQMGGSQDDIGNAILLSSDGGVLTTGTFRVTADFDPGAGTANLTSAGGKDVFISKLDASGNFVWVRGMGGTGDEVSGAVAWGNNGSIICCGEFSNTVDFNPGGGTFNLVSNGGFDAFVVKTLEQAPTAVQLSTATIAEHQPIGLVIGSLSTVDPDTSDTHVYSLVSGTGDSDNACFTIAGNQLKTNVVFNYETKSTYSIRVRSTSGRGLWVEKSFTVNVSDAVEEAVSGILWRDADADGVHDASEAGVKDAVVRLFYSPDATIGNSDDRLVSETLTDAQGTYVFHEVAHSMNYYLSFYTPPGLRFTLRDAGGDDNQDSDVDATGNTGLFTLTPGQTASNFYAGLIGTQPASGWAIGSGGYYSADVAHSTVQDAAGNVYVTGFFNNTIDFDPSPQVYDLIGDNSDVDVFVAKYSPSGSLLWARSWGGSYTDVANSIAVAGDGSVYTLGYFRYTTDFDPGPGTYNLNGTANYSLFISKLDQAGNFVWAKKLELDSGRGIAIATGPSGNVYFTGIFDSSRDFDPGSGTFLMASNGGEDVFVEKLSAAGDFVWAKSFGGPGNDRGSTVAVGSDESIVISGYFGNTTDFDPGAATFNLTSVGSSDIFISKLSSEGNFLWAKSMGGSDADGGNSVAIKSDGSIFVTGYFYGMVDFDPGLPTFNLNSAGSSDIFITQLTAAGSFVGAWRMGGNSSDSGYSIAIDGNGSIFTSGAFNATADFDPGAGTFNVTSKGYQDAFVSKLDSSGNILWARAMGGSANDGGVDISAGADGSIVTVGYFSSTVDFDPGPNTYNISSHGDLDFFIVKFDAIHRPTDITPSASTIEENRPVGTVIAQFSTADPDSSDTHVYSLVSGAGGDDNGSFVIDGNQLKSNAVFNSKTKSNYSIRVQTMDGTGLYFEKVFTITIIATAPILRTWDGGSTDNKWSTAANWVGDIAPSAGDSLEFPTGASRLESTNDYPLGTQFGSITISGNGYRFTNGINSTSTVHIPSGTLTVKSIVADTLTIGSLVVPTTRTWDGGGTDNNWSTAANWTGDVAPLPGDNLVFPAGAAKLQSVNNYPAGTIFGSINVPGGNYSFQNGITSSSTVQVSSGTLTTSSIACDTLTIGSAPGAASAAATSLANDSVMQTVDDLHPVTIDLITSTIADKAVIAPYAIHSPAKIDHLGFVPAKTISISAIPAASIAASINDLFAIPSAISHPVSASTIGSTVNSMVTIEPPQNKAEIIAPLRMELFAQVVLADRNLMTTASSCSFRLTDRLIDSVYAEPTESLAVPKKQPSIALGESQNTRILALQSLMQNDRYDSRMVPIDSEFLSIKHLRKQDKLVKAAIDEFHEIF